MQPEIVNLVQDYRNSVLLEAMRAVCPCCARGDMPVDARWGLHNGTTTCIAAPIRDLMTQDKEHEKA